MMACNHAENPFFSSSSVMKKVGNAWKHFDAYGHENEITLIFESVECLVEYNQILQDYYRNSHDYKDHKADIIFFGMVVRKFLRKRTSRIEMKYLLPFSDALVSITAKL